MLFARRYCGSSDGNKKKCTYARCYRGKNRSKLCTYGTQHIQQHMPNTTQYERTSNAIFLSLSLYSTHGTPLNVKGKLGERAAEVVVFMAPTPPP